MPRRPRHDGPDSWHHVFNRALSKRPLFLSAEDHRHFLAGVARAVRAKQIEVHRFALVVNHYHLLARSPTGQLGSAMHDIQMHHAQYLNRRLGRDGPLFRNRYKSRIVTSHGYHRTLVSYIDANPVAAGIVARAEDYPWSSASHHAAGRQPPWLSMDWIEAQVREHTGREDYAACRETFPLRLDPDFLGWVERRLRGRGDARDDMDIVLGADPERTLEWMGTRARLADGDTSFLPVATASAVLSAIAASDADIAALTSRVSRGPPVRGADTLPAGLLRDAASLRWAEIAKRTSSTPATVRNRCLAHRARLVEDPAYARLAARIVRAATRETAGVP
jgi:REP element-mobilizing transposase RayT